MLSSVVGILAEIEYAVEVAVGRMTGDLKRQTAEICNVFGDDSVASGLHLERSDADLQLHYRRTKKGKSVLAEEDYLGSSDASFSSDDGEFQSDFDSYDWDEDDQRSRGIDLPLQSRKPDPTTRSHSQDHSQTNSNPDLNTTQIQTDSKSIGTDTKSWHGRAMKGVQSKSLSRVEMLDKKLTALLLQQTKNNDKEARLRNRPPIQQTPQRFVGNSRDRQMSPPGRACPPAAPFPPTPPLPPVVLKRNASEETLVSSTDPHPAMTIEDIKYGESGKRPLSPESQDSNEAARSFADEKRSISLSPGNIPHDMHMPGSMPDDRYGDIPQDQDMPRNMPGNRRLSSASEKTDLDILRARHGT